MILFDAILCFGCNNFFCYTTPGWRIHGFAFDFYYNNYVLDSN